jgi:hypothetical protein
MSKAKQKMTNSLHGEAEGSESDNMLSLEGPMSFCPKSGNKQDISGLNRFLSLKLNEIKSSSWHQNKKIMAVH